MLEAYFSALSQSACPNKTFTFLTLLHSTRLEQTLYQLADTAVNASIFGPGEQSITVDFLIFLFIKITSLKIECKTHL